MGIIENIVDRCHVSLSDEEVLAEVISRMAGGQATFDALTIGQQQFIKIAAERKHAANRDLFREVATGRLFNGI